MHFLDVIGDVFIFATKSFFTDVIWVKFSNYSVVEFKPASILAFTILDKGIVMALVCSSPMDNDSFKLILIIVLGHLSLKYMKLFFV